MYNNYYYGNYYDYYYNGLYNNYYYQSNYDYTSDTETVTTYSTEIPAYSPLLFQIYIEPKEQ